MNTYTNFTVEAKYPLSIFQNSGLECSWNTVKVGWDLKRLTVDEIGKFALNYLENHPHLINPYISELIFGVRDYTMYEIDEHLKKLFVSLHLSIPEEGSPAWNKEWRKWRFCILNSIKNNITNKEGLLEAVEWLYNDFGHPDDMAVLIYNNDMALYYMGQLDDNNEVLKRYEKCCKNLTKEINDFLGEEKALIESNYH